MSLVVQQEALIRLFVKKGIFSKEEFLEMAPDLPASAPSSNPSGVPGGVPGVPGGG